MNKGILLLTGAFDWHPEEWKELSRAGYQPIFMQNERDRIPPDGEKAVTIVCNSLFLYHGLSGFPYLRTIQLTSAGLDRVDEREICQKGISVYNAEDAYSVPMAEWILLRILELFKESGKLWENQCHHRWEKHRQLPELAGKRVLIIGTGYVGRAAAKRISAFEANVMGVNRSGHSVPEFQEVYSAEQLDELLPSTDILILALPLTADTFGLIDGRRLALLPCTSVIINVSRGRILDEAALTDALKGQRLFGAALDVFAQEPLPADSPLWDMERVLISSHNSFSGAGNHQRLWRVIRKNLIERVGKD